MGVWYIQVFGGGWEWIVLFRETLSIRLVNGECGWVLVYVCVQLLHLHTCLLYKFQHTRTCTYRRSDFDCEILLIVNFNFFKNSRSKTSKMQNNAVFSMIRNLTRWQSFKYTIETRYNYCLYNTLFLYWLLKLHNYTCSYNWISGSTTRIIWCPFWTIHVVP